MSLLVRLGLSQSNPWDPPTVLDRFLASPVQCIAHFLWRFISWRRSEAMPKVEKPRNERSEEQSEKRNERSEDQKDQKSEEQKKIRVVCLSDTHDMLPETPPPGDLLIHAGDMTNHGRPADLQKQLDWLAAQPHTHKVVICGNHDSWFDPRGRKLKAAELAAEQGEDVTSWEETGGGGPTVPEGIHYLERSSVQLSFPNGRSILVYGAPDIPRCGPDTFAFQYPREDPSIWNDSIPNDVDILVTHPPPRHHLDLELGCVGLLREVWRVRPALHVFGHVHWGAGRTRLWWDDTQRIYEALFGGEEAPLSETWSTLPRRLGLLARLAWTATGYLLWPGTLRPVAGTRTSLLINPAQMYGNTGRLGPNVQVADI